MPPRSAPLVVIALAAGACARDGARPLAPWPATDVAVRALAPCERAFVRAEPAHAFELDVGIADGRERWLVAGGDVDIVDAGCTRVLASYQMSPVTDRGPSLTTTPWRNVPAATIAQLGATDRLPSGVRYALQVWGAADAPIVTVIAVGGSTSKIGLPSHGYDALAIACRAGSCRGATFAHHEHVAAPVETCHLVRRSVGEHGHGLFELRARGEEVVVAQRYEETDTCRSTPPRSAVWRTTRL